MTEDQLNFLDKEAKEQGLPARGDGTRKRRREPWSFEHAFSLKRKHIGRLYADDQPAAIRLLKRRIANACNALDESKSKTMLILLVAGLDAIESAIKGGEKGKLPKTGSAEAQEWAIIQKLLEVHRHRAKIRQLTDLLEAMRDTIAFSEWCKENLIDQDIVNEVLKGYSWKARKATDKKTKTDEYKEWLFRCLDDGKEHQLANIKQAAIRDNIIADPEDDPDQHKADLGLLKQVASDADASGGKRGYWQLPVEDESPF